MLLKKTLIFAGLVMVLTVLLMLWLFDRLMVLNGRDNGRKFFTRPSMPLGAPQPEMQFHSLRRSA